MKKQSVLAKFDALASRYAARYHNPTPLAFEHVHRMELLTRFAVEKQPESVLDAGCGPGVVLSALGRQLPNSRLVGVDLSASMLKEAAENGFLARRLLQADVENLPFQEASFDLVYALGVINFLEDPALFLGSVGRVLKPGGYFVFTYPNKDCINRTLAVYLKACVKRRAHSRPAVAAVPIKGATLRPMIACSGLELLETRFITFGNGLVSLPWSVSFSRAMERVLGQSHLGVVFAWSCFCIAYKPEEPCKASTARNARRLRPHRKEEGPGGQAAVRRMVWTSQNPWREH
jgi:ubiquinone/menaquinone biosynthesis C-methylase UbiE